MRRATTILMVLFCAVTGCRGSAAQEPYAAVIAAQVPQPPEVEPIASEVDVPWAIALISDRPARTVERPARVIVVDRTASVDEPDGDVDVQVVVDGVAVDEHRPAEPKSCSGVVNRRS